MKKTMTLGCNVEVKSIEKTVNVKNDIYVFRL